MPLGFMLYYFKEGNFTAKLEHRVDSHFHIPVKYSVHQNNVKVKYWIIDHTLKVILNLKVIFPVCNVTKNQQTCRKENNSRNSSSFHTKPPFESNTEPDMQLCLWP